MTRHVGVVRNAAGLADAIKTFAKIEREADSDRVLSNMALAARFVAGAALLREESRGAHYRNDFPDAKPSLAARSFLNLTDLNDIDARRGSLETAHQVGAHP
jgi:L-aspartate oxidase